MGKNIIIIGIINIIIAISAYLYYLIVPNFFVYLYFRLTFIPSIIIIVLSKDINSKTLRKINYFINISYLIMFLSMYSHIHMNLS